MRMLLLSAACLLSLASCPAANAQTMMIFNWEPVPTTGRVSPKHPVQLRLRVNVVDYYRIVNAQQRAADASRLRRNQRRQDRYEWFSHETSLQNRRRLPFGGANVGRFSSSFSMFGE